MLELDGDLRIFLEYLMHVLVGLRTKRGTERPHYWKVWRNVSDRHCLREPLAKFLAKQPI